MLQACSPWMLVSCVARMLVLCRTCNTAAVERQTVHCCGCDEPTYENHGSCIWGLYWTEFWKLLRAGFCKPLSCVSDASLRLDRARAPQQQSWWLGWAQVVKSGRPLLSMSTDLSDSFGAGNCSIVSLGRCKHCCLCAQDSHGSNTGGRVLMRVEPLLRLQPGLYPVETCKGRV